MTTATTTHTQAACGIQQNLGVASHMTFLRAIWPASPLLQYLLWFYFALDATNEFCFIAWPLNNPVDLKLNKVKGRDG